MATENPPVDLPSDGSENEIVFGNKTFAWYKWAAWFAKRIFESGAQRQLTSANQAFAILCKGEELGLPPFAAWTWIYTTKQGRLAIQSKGALAVVQSKTAVYGGYKEWIEDEGQPTMRACAQAVRIGFDPTLKEFSLKDAETAGLLRQRHTQQGEKYDSTYQSYLKDMLLSRVRGRVLDIAYAAELGGIDIEGPAEDADMMEARRRPEKAEPKQLQAPRGDPLLTELGARPALTAGAPAAPVVVGSSSTVSSGPPPAAQPTAGKPAKARKAPIRPRGATGIAGPAAEEATPTATKAEPKASPPPEPSAPTQCGRCAGGLNQMGGCDVCGWPGPDIR